MKHKLLKGNAELINSKAKFSCKAKGRPEIIVDYTPPLGDGEGYTSLELLLLSLTSCLSSSIKFILEGKMNKTVLGIKSEVSGQRKLEHPTSFETIELFIELEAEDVSEDEINKVLKLAEEKLCPVYDMLKGNVKIKTNCKLKEGIKI